MNFCTIQRRCRNLLLCFRLDARISNILIFMRHFFHQKNKGFYLHSLIFNVVSVKADRKPKTDMHVVRQTAFQCRTCKNHAKLWLMHAKVFEKESKTNNEHTVAVLCQRHDYIPWYHFFIFCFLIKHFTSFFSSFYYCNWPENSHHHAYSRHRAN